MKNYQILLFATLALFFFAIDRFTSDELGLAMLGAIISLLLASESFRRNR
jgi:hypothetical protein